MTPRPLAARGRGVVLGLLVGSALLVLWLVGGRGNGPRNVPAGATAPGAIAPRDATGVADRGVPLALAASPPTRGVAPVDETPPRAKPKPAARGAGRPRRAELWSAPSEWYGRLAAPGDAGPRSVAGVEMGVAFWRIAATAPFPSRTAWFAAGRTDADGRLRLELPSIRKDRAQNAELLAEIPGVGWVAAPLDWRATSPDAEQVVPLGVSARVVVHVRRADGEPAPGVVAELWGDFRVRSARTRGDDPERGWDAERSWSGSSDASGDIVFACVPAGQTLSLRLHEGDVEVWREEGAVFARPGEVLHVAVRLAPTTRGRLHGRVRTYAGDPCEGYRVWAGVLRGGSYPDDLLVPVASAHFPYRTETDQDGRYALDVPLGGRVTVAVQPSRSEGPQRRRTVPLGADAPERRVDFVVAFDRAVFGTVLGPDGAPVHGARVRLLRPSRLGARGDDDLRERMVRTNLRGAFRAEHVPGGPLLADVESDEGVLPAPVRVRPGRLVLQLSASGSASFVVEGGEALAAGEPVAVRLFDGTGALARTAVATVGAEQAVAGIPPGLYTLVASGDGGSAGPVAGRLDDLRVPATGTGPTRTLELAPVTRGHLRLVRRGRRPGMRRVTLRHDRTLATEEVVLGRNGSTLLVLDAGLWELRWRSDRDVPRVLSLVLGAGEERELEHAFD